MSSRLEIRRLLKCDWCGWEVYSRTIPEADVFRKVAAEKDGWRVVDGEDVCGQLHAREKEGGR